MKPACPVDDDVRRWVEARMFWLAREFGEDRLRTVMVVTPTTEFFPTRWHGGGEEAKALCKRIAGFMGVDFGRITVYRHGSLDDTDRLAEALGAGTFGEVDGRFLIGYDPRKLEEPLHLAATFAHELAHVHLLGDGRIVRDEPDGEQLTDLCTVALGMGVIAANASLSDYVSRGGWDVRVGVRRLGYLDLKTYGYASAVFAHLRREDDPTWAKHLRADVRATMRQGRKWIDAKGIDARMAVGEAPLPADFFNLMDVVREHFERKADERLEEMTAAEKTCHYCGKRNLRGADAQGLPTCRSCLASIRENEEALAAADAEIARTAARTGWLWKWAVWIVLALIMLMAYVGVSG